jgi:hypothetical protein
MARARSFKQILVIVDMVFGGGRAPRPAAPSPRLDLPGTDARRKRTSDFIGRRRRPVPIPKAVP